MEWQSFPNPRFRQLAWAMVYISVYLAAIVALASCQKESIKPYWRTAGAAKVSICEIVAHKDSYIGGTVEIYALWKTDNLNYGLFEDIKPETPKCRDQDSVQLGYKYKMHDESVVEFFSDGKKLCEAKNRLISCTQEAYVRFIGTIMSDKDGLYVHLDKVLSYKYIE